MQAESVSRAGRVRLGQAINLLHGSDPFPIGPASLRQAAGVPLRQGPGELPSQESRWQPFTVSAHRDVASLVDHLWGCAVEPLRFDGPGFDVRPARLTRSDQDQATRYTRLEEMLGVPLIDGRSYLLVELRRTDGRADHEVTARPARAYFDRNRHLTPGWRKAATRLRPGERIHDGFQHDAFITAAMAQHYVDAFYAFGTHFISAVEGGDALIQVVALQPTACDRVFRYWQQIGEGQPVSGADAIAFGAFLGAACATDVGRITSLAGDPQLTASLARGEWSDPSSLGGTSLFGLLRSGREAARERLAAFTATAAIHVELTSLARFMEYFRALNFERVLRGALMQRWGERVHLPLRRLPRVERAIAAKDEDEALSAGGTDTRVAGCHRVLSLRAQRSHDHSGTVLAQFLDAEPVSHRASILRLRQTAFEAVPIVCQTMAGALILEDEYGSRDAVVDGLRFTAAAPEADTGWPRVRVRGALHSLDPRYLAEALPCIRAALARAAVTLSCGDAGEQERSDAAAFAGWLATVIPAGSNETDVQRLRARALYLSRVDAGLPAGQTGLDVPTCSRIQDHLAAISAFAIAADERLRDHDARLWSRARSSSPEHDASLPLEEADTLRALRSLRHSVSNRYLAVLAEVYRAQDEAVQRALGAHRASAAALVDVVTGLVTAPGSDELGPAGRALLDALVSASSLQPRAGADTLLNRRADETVNVALEFAGREARVHARAVQLQAIDELCGMLTQDAAGLDAAERGLAALGEVQESGWPSVTLAGTALRAVLMDGVHRGTELERSIDNLSAAWEGFETTRCRLMAARGALSRVRMETWYFSVLDADDPSCEPPHARDGLARVPQHQLHLERFRLLTLLGQALRCQRAMLHSAGLASPASVGRFEPGAIGHLLALQIDLLAKRSVDPHVVLCSRTSV